MADVNENFSKATTYRSAGPLVRGQLTSFPLYRPISRRLEALQQLETFISLKKGPERAVYIGVIHPPMELDMTSDISTQTVQKFDADIYSAFKSDAYRLAALVIRQLVPVLFSFLVAYLGYYMPQTNWIY
jgi:hypothetical protein